MDSLIIERAPEEQKTGSKNLLAPVEGIIGAGFCHRRIRWWCHFRICLLERLIIVLYKIFSYY